MKLVVFDLDGTLTDSAEGIKNSIKSALKSGDLPIPTNDVLNLFIGPPIIDSFKEHCHMNDTEAHMYYQAFKKRYVSIGKFENKVYQDIPHVLSTLRKKDYIVAVATAKPEEQAREILEHFQLASYFHVIKGANYNTGIIRKDGILHAALEASYQLLPPNCNYTVQYMVGDRMYDMHAAKEYGCKGIGVLYGYGTLEELKKANATYLCNTPLDVLDVILENDNT